MTSHGGAILTRTAKKNCFSRWIEAAHTARVAAEGEMSVGPLCRSQVAALPRRRVVPCKPRAREPGPALRLVATLGLPAPVQCRRRKWAPALRRCWFVGASSVAVDGVEDDGVDEVWLCRGGVVA